MIKAIILFLPGLEIRQIKVSMNSKKFYTVHFFFYQKKVIWTKMQRKCVKN